MIENGYIVAPDEYLMPSYRISSFRTEDIIKNQKLPFSKQCDKYFTDRFKNNNYLYTKNGRQAINIALSKLNLEKNDYVTIFTTTNNFYISGCVTKEIEKYCNWSRKIEKNTKVILINHEFGFPYENLLDLQKYNLPIIEDCAYSFYSNNEEQSVSHVGDFVIYSFPKYFPIQIGGLLVYNDKYNIGFEINKDDKSYIQKVLSYYIKDIENWSKIRKENYSYLESSLNSFGVETRFKLKNEVTPGVYMFTVGKDVNADLFKKNLWDQGIQCSVFYKEKVMYIPVNNRLGKEDLNYFVECIKYFTNRRLYGK